MHNKDIVELLRKAQEEAYNKGYVHGCSQAMRMMSDEPNLVMSAANPYVKSEGSLTEDTAERCPSICSPKAAAYGYVEGSRCEAEVGHSNYRNIVGHHYPRVSPKDRNNEQLY